MPSLDIEPITDEERTNQEYVQAHLAVAGLTLAWHYVLRTSNHEAAATLIEKALEATIQLRTRTRRKGKEKPQGSLAGG